MKTTAAIVALSAAVVSASPQHEHGLPEGAKVNCSKPNAAFCMGDLILRCDGNSQGTPGRCSDNVSGYPPAGGVATCYETDKLAGDAACMKNCVVYAEESYTLPADVCDPSVIPSELQDTAVPTPTQDAGTTGIVTIPEGTGVPPVPLPTPISTSIPSVIIDPIPSEYLTNSSTAAPTTMGTITDVPSQSTPATSTPATSTPPTQPTGAAPANQAAMGGLAIAGIVAAYLV